MASRLVEVKKTSLRKAKKPPRATRARKIP